MFPRFVSAQLLIVAYMHSSILFQCVITQMSLKSKAIISRIGEEYIQCVCVCVCVVSEYAIVDSVHAHAHALQQLDYRSGTGRIYSIYLDSTHYTHLLSCQRIGHSCQCTNTQIHYHRIMFFSLFLSPKPDNIHVLCSTEDECILIKSMDINNRSDWCLQCFVVYVFDLPNPVWTCQTFSIYIIAIAGAESAIGLGILVAFYRLRGSIAIEYK